MNFREASLAITPKHHNCCASLQTPEAWNPVWSSLGNCLRLNHLPIFRDSLVLLKELFFSGKTSSFLFVCSFFFVGYFCLKIPDIFTSNSYMCWFEKKWIVARWSHINSSDFEDFFFDWKSELLDEKNILKPQWDFAKALHQLKPLHSCEAGPALLIWVVLFCLFAFSGGSYSSLKINLLTSFLG